MTNEVPDDVLQAFWDGNMSDEGMKNLISDFRSGRVSTKESEDIPITESIKRMITGKGRRVPETEKLRSWVRMPEMNSLSLRGLKSLVGTMAANPKEIGMVLKKQWPEIEVDKDSKGNIVFTSGIDGEQYAIKPGFRAEEDLARGAATGMLFAMGAKGSIPQRLAGAGAVQYGIEATQQSTGGQFNNEEVPIAMLFEGGAIPLEKASALIKGVFRGAKAPKKLAKAANKVRQRMAGGEPEFFFPQGEVARTPLTAEEQALKTAQGVGIEPMTSDIFPPKTFVGKTAQQTVERIPLVGTGGQRAAQQESRQAAIKRILTENGAMDAANASDDVTAELIKKHGANIQKYNNLKTDVIERLSDDAGAGNIITDNDYQNLIREKYFKGDQKIASSRTTPQNKLDIPLGTKKVDSIGIPGEREIAVLEEVPIEGLKLKLSEDTFGPRLKDVKQYKEWLKAGNEAPPVTIYQTEKGNLKIVDGHRRYLAAKESGQKNIKAWVYRLNKSGKPITESSHLVPIDNTTKMISGEVERLRGLNTPETNALADIIEPYAENLSNRNLSEVEELRKVLGERLKAEDLASVRGQSEKTMRKLYGALNEDMGAYIKANGQPRDFTKWKIANQRLAEGIQESQKTALKQVLNKGEMTPEVVRKMLFSKKPSEIRLLYKNLTPRGKRSARTAVWQEAYNNAGGEEMTTARFRTELKKLERTSGIVFSKQDKQVFDGLIKALDMTKRAEQANVMVRTGEQLTPAILPGFSAALSGYMFGWGPSTAVATFGGPATIGAAAKIYESKPVRNTLIKIAKGQGNERVLISQLANMLRVSQQMSREDTGKSYFKGGE